MIKPNIQTEIDRFIETYLYSSNILYMFVFLKEDVYLFPMDTGYRQPTGSAGTIQDKIL